MIKKLLLMAALISPLFSAETYIDSIDKHYGGHGIYKIRTKILHPDNTPGKFPGANYDNNWVGVYKKGVSNDWGNVLKWSWERDLDDCSDNNNEGCINFGDLEDGEYDIRFFLNNSYTTDYSKTVKLESENQPSFIKITQNYDDGLIDVVASSRGNRTWIGVYKKGASNAWKNVLGWTWYNADQEINSVRVPNPVSNTTYEARLFYNNSYKLEAKVAFTIEADIIEPEISFAQQRDAVLIFETTTSGKGNKDWVGLYKVGDSNSWNNVLAWSWVDVEDEGYGKSFDVNLIPSGEYELRLFYHNSYKVEAVKNVELDFN